MLDIGCGTGKAAVALARRGLSVLGVDLDERMADGPGATALRWRIAAFETWEDAGRQFALITCAEACHWIDPALAIRVYRRHAPEVTQVWRPTRRKEHPYSDGVALFADSGTFSSVETRTYLWERTLSAHAWVGLAATVSDHQRLGDEPLAALLQELDAISPCEWTVPPRLRMTAMQGLGAAIQKLFQGDLPVALGTAQSALLNWYSWLVPQIARWEAAFINWVLDPRPARPTRSHNRSAADHRSGEHGMSGVPRPSRLSDE